MRRNRGKFDDPGAEVLRQRGHEGEERIVAADTLDADRGLFLDGNVAAAFRTSRARCVAVLVASPALLRPGCKSVRQMQLANGVVSVWGDGGGG